MNILKNPFLFIKKVENKKVFNQSEIVHYEEIAKLVKEARIRQNITIQDLSRISKIPEKTLTSIEENNKTFIPKHPFIRSILIKLEECLVLKENTLVKFATSEVETFKKEKQKFIISKLDFINTWQGTILYFFILIFTLFIIKRYFILNINIIEIQNIENKSLKNNIQ